MQSTGVKMDINRDTAYAVLMDMERNHSYSNLALNHFIEKKQPDEPGFVRELVYGVTENRILLDYYLSALIPSGLRRVKKPDLTLLRMGLYQILFLNSVPPYAAVSETVNMARKFCRGREGFINGVLRNFQRKAESGQLPALPDREEHQAEYLSVKYSAARWLTELWLASFGLQKTEQLLQASNGRPVLSLRVNCSRISREELQNLLAEEGFDCEPGALSERILLLKGKGSGILESRLYREGLFSVQDQASAAAADLLHPSSKDLVIDVCAAPGGKTLAMAEAMKGNGEVVAFDIYEHKLKLIQQQAERLGMNNIRTFCQDGRQVCERFRGKADCVLADVPCSGLGVLRRKPEIKLKNADEMDFAELIHRQAEILHTASQYVKPGGTLVYSTCTVNPAENEMQIRRFLKMHPDFIQEAEKQLLPDRESDGFYMCRLRKKHQCAEECSGSE